MKTEILAPAGNYEALVSAVRSGADAVYFGTGNFNARRNAGNFEDDELVKAVEFCHLHAVKCHITLNTLVSDDEIDELKNTVKRICQAKADALILQDLGAVKIVKQCALYQKRLQRYNFFLIQPNVLSTKNAPACNESFFLHCVCATTQ